jgi:hypothetical protein
MHRVLTKTHPASELEEDAERREDDVDAGRRAVRRLLRSLSIC